MAVGRISGPLLKDNLLRNGVNLAFETSLLYLDVNNSQIGVNTATPQYTLDVNGTTNTTNLSVTTQTLIGTGGNQFTISGNTIANSNSIINLTPAGGSNGVVYQGKISVGNLTITGNTVSNTVTNDDINISLAAGATTAQIKLNNNTLINGNLHATGVITTDGNITLGNDVAQDTVTFSSEVSSNILPKLDNTYNLGSASFNWANLHVTTVTATTLNTTNLTATGTLSVTSTSTLSGNTTIGASSSNTVTVNSSINSSLVPLTTATYNIGTASLYWNNVYGTTFTTSGLTINGNTITSTGTNSNLQLTANGSGSVTVPNNTLAVTGNATVGGTLRVTGTSTFAAVGITGTLTQTGNFGQTGGNFTTSGTINSGAITSSGSLILPNLTFSGTTITGTNVAANLILTPYAGKKVEITSSALFDNSLSVLGNLGVTGFTSLNGVNIAGTLTQTGNFSQTSGNFTTTGTINSGAITSSGILTLPKITISGSVVSGTQSGTNLQITAYSGQAVEITSNATLDGNATVGGNLTVTGTTNLKTVNINGTVTQTGNYTQTGNFSTTGNFTTRTTTVTGNVVLSGEFTVPGITISNSTITTNTGSLDLNLTANGSGSVIFQGIKVTNNNIQVNTTNTDLLLTPNGTGSVVVNNTQSFVIPVGTTTERPASPANGMIRYNTTDTSYEGYSSGQWAKLSGVQSIDRKTRITPELTPGTGDNIIRFYVNNTSKTYIDSTKLYTDDFQTSGINISNNTISAISADSDVNLTTSGSGGVVIGNLKFTSNTITNVVTDAVTTFNKTGTGYVKISGTNGVVLPVGSSYPSNVELGMVRYNGTGQYVEMYTGPTTGWQNVAGPAAGVTQGQATDLSIVYAVLFG